MISAVPVNIERPQAPPSRVFVALLLASLLLVATGCPRGSRILPAELRKPIDRSLVEFPSGMLLERYVEKLNAPTAIAFDTQKNVLLIAESGLGGGEPRILAFNYANEEEPVSVVYPQGKVLGPFRSNPFRMFAPIGGMAVRDGVIYVSHRDKDGVGVVSAVTYDGKGSTVVAGLPAQGDYGVTDVAFNPVNGRLYFGVGSATNSGVVGLDNWDVGWVQKHPKLADKLYALPNETAWRLRGAKFFSSNPLAGLFTGYELAITAPFQPFGEYTRSRIGGDDKPNAAIYSVQPSGGIASDLRVEAYGIRLPSGLAFGVDLDLYFSNQGMELRGTRPVKDDPNTILKLYPGRFYGWPDFTANLRPITDSDFQPDEEMLRKSGYTENNFILDHPGHLDVPFQPADIRLMVKGEFPSLSGAAKMAFVPEDGPMNEFGRELIVALSGDRAPFATSNRKLKNPVGYKVVRVDVDRALVRDFIRNTAEVPRSRARGKGRPGAVEMLERPIDVKIGPDGYIYVLDLGAMEFKGGDERATRGTGQVFRLRPADSPAATTNPAETRDVDGAAGGSPNP